MSWKTVAIIFIILFVLVSAFTIYIFSYGAGEVAKENKCVNKCMEFDAQGTYWYESEGKCTCKNADGDSKYYYIE